MESSVAPLRTLDICNVSNPMNKPSKRTNYILLPRRGLRALSLGPVLLLASLTNAQVDEEDEVFELSPFTVEGTEETGYRATSTLAGTRIRTNLKDVGSAISVVTEAFLQDTNSNNSEDLLVYTTSTEVAGQGGNFVGQGSGTFLDTTSRNSPIQNSRVRGLAEADNTRNYYLSDIPWDSYNVSRVDLQRGPNSVLFGIGSPAGIINAGLQSAAFEDENEVRFDFGSFGSYRVSGNFNKVLIEDELAIRLALLSDNTDYRQEPAFKDDERIYAALSWNPKALSSDRYNTEISLNYEKGKIDSNRPRQTPPIDAITPWFTQMGQQTYRGEVMNSDDPADWYEADGVTPNGYGGATLAVSPNYSPWIGAAGNRVYDGVVVAYTPEDGQGPAFAADVRPYPSSDGGNAGSGGGSIRGINTFNQYALNQGLVGADISAHKAKSLTDPRIFDFYNHLLDGPNKSEFNDFDAANVAFRQNFFDNKLGYELAYDKQEAEWGRSNFLAGDGASVTVDIMETFVDGTPNPNAGRPMVVAGGSVDGYHQIREREVARLTVYGELDFTDSSNDMVGNIFGRHVFTGLYNENTIENQTFEYKRNFIGGSFAPNSGAAVNQAQRDAILFSYLGGNLQGASLDSGLNLPRVMSVQNPASADIRVWNNTPVAGFDPEVDDPDDPNNYVGWETIPLEIVNAYAMPFDDQPYTKATITNNKIKSEALVWQGYLFGGNIVPMLGWRKDTDTARSAGTAPGIGGAGNGGIVDPFNPDFRLPSGPDDLDMHGRDFNSESDESITKSIVAHVPATWTDAAGIGLSFHYSESENFQPDAGRIDVLGNSVPSPTGETEEYGFTVSAFENKLVLKANWYETRVANATAGDNIGGGQYLIGAIEAWGQQYALEARDRRGAFANSFGTSSSGGTVVYQPAGDPGPGGEYTQAQLDEVYAIQEAAIAAWLDDPVPEQFQQTWALTDYETAGGQTNFGPPGLVVTSDTNSEGFELELTANPMEGLSVAFNAAKMEAQRVDLADGYVDWVESRWDDFQNTPQGDIRLWGAQDDNTLSDQNGETVEGKFMRETISNLNLWRALEGSNVPELVEWRYNAVVNYAFSDGRFSGFNVGGSARYQEAPTIGFPTIQDAEGVTSYDVTNPFKGDYEVNFDFWLGYERELTDRIHWRIQANVRNAFAEKELHPVTVQPDGTMGTLRIGAPTTWTLSNTFTF